MHAHVQGAEGQVHPVQHHAVTIQCHAASHQSRQAGLVAKLRGVAADDGIHQLAHACGSNLLTIAEAPVGLPVNARHGLNHGQVGGQVAVLLHQNPAVPVGLPAGGGIALQLAFPAHEHRVVLFHIVEQVIHLHRQRPGDFTRGERLAVLSQKRAVKARQAIVVFRVMHVRVHKAAHEVQVIDGFHIAVVGHAVALGAQAGADEHIRSLPPVLKAQRHGEGLPVKGRIVHRHGNVVVLVAPVDLHNMLLVSAAALPAQVAHAIGYRRIGHGGQGQQHQQRQHRGQVQFPFHDSLLLSGDSPHENAVRRGGDVRVQLFQPAPQLIFLHGQLPPLRRSFPA